MKSRSQQDQTHLHPLVQMLFEIPWFNLIGPAWRAGYALWQQLTAQGLYVVDSYEGVLELLDEAGEKARFSKNEDVHYIQNSIIAYQDQAWGDGDILRNYKCTPGLVVDRYRAGHKIWILISLRSQKKKGDSDTFRITRNIRNGFLRDHEHWDTEITHLTKEAKMGIVFPKGRPPKTIQLTTFSRRKFNMLDKEALPDGRWLVSWCMTNPKLNERYSIEWEW